MDLIAIFQQINLQYQWAIRVSAILTLNRLDVCMIFFSFIYTSSLSTSESCAKTPLPDSIACFFDPQQSFGNPLRTFWQYLASPVLEKSRFFSATAKFSSLIREDLCDASLSVSVFAPAGFWPSAGGNTDTIQLSRNTINFVSYGNAPEVYHNESIKHTGFQQVPFLLHLKSQEWETSESRP